MARKSKIDLERLECDYRAGSLSPSEIARLHGCTPTYVGKVAKERGWSRNLEARVRAVTEAKLAAQAPLTPDGEAVAVEEAAAMRVSVVLSHRKHIGRLQGIVSNLYRAVEHQSEALGEFDPSDDKDKIIKALVGPHQVTQTVQRLADAQAKLITLERQAFGIADDAAAPQEKPYEERLRELMGQAEE